MGGMPKTPPFAAGNTHPVMVKLCEEGDPLEGSEGPRSTRLVERPTLADYWPLVAKRDRKPFIINDDRAEFKSACTPMDYTPDPYNPSRTPDASEALNQQIAAILHPEAQRSELAARSNQEGHAASGNS
jgi:hypothetical protein